MKEPVIEFDREQFLKDRKAMLLALDVGKMRAYAKKYGSTAPADDDICLASMHMARTGALDLPTAEREYSRQWLAAHGYEKTLG